MPSFTLNKIATRMYKDLEATLHDLFWRAEPDADESQLLEKYLLSYPGKSLEVGCGSGRLLIPLVKKGFDVEGVEISSDMIQLLHQEAQSEELSVNVYLSDIETFTTGSLYQSISIPAFTLQLFSREMAMRVLSKLRKLSSDKSALYFTVFIPWAEILDELEGGVWHLDKEAALPDQRVASCHTRHEVNRVEQTLSREHRYQISSSTGETQQEHKSKQELQWYLLPELKLLLANAGWNYLRHDADFTSGLVDSDAHILTIYATAF